MLQTPGTPRARIMAGDVQGHLGGPARPSAGGALFQMKWAAVRGEQGEWPSGSHKLLSRLRLSFLINFAWQTSPSLPEPSQVSNIRLSAVGLTGSHAQMTGRRQGRGGGRPVLGARQTPARAPATPACRRPPAHGYGPVAGPPKKQSLREEEVVGLAGPVQGAVTDRQA